MTPSRLAASATDTRGQDSRGSSHLVTHPLLQEGGSPGVVVTLILSTGLVPPVFPRRSRPPVQTGEQPFAGE